MKRGYRLLTLGDGIVHFSYLFQNPPDLVKPGPDDCSVDSLKVALHRLLVLLGHSWLLGANNLPWRPLHLLGINLSLICDHLRLRVLNLWILKRCATRRLGIRGPRCRILGTELLKLLRNISQASRCRLILVLFHRINLFLRVG